MSKRRSNKALESENGKPDRTDKPPGSDMIESDFPLVNMLEMNKGELMVLMMKLLKMLTVKGSITLRSKPKWWPEDIQWGVLESLNTLELVTVIKKCYTAYDKENLVTSVCVRSPAVESTNPKKDAGWKTASLTKSIDSNNPKSIDSNNPQSPIMQRSLKELHLPFAVEIYICYFCEKEFVDKEAMRHHQKFCKERPPELVLSSSIKPFDRSEPNFDPPQISPKSSRLRLDVNRKFIPLSEFVEYLGLVPSRTASKIKAERKCSEISSDILEDAEPLSPSIPQTPRTPKSLISQLSRDEPRAIAKKRLSYSLSVEKSAQKNELDTEDESSDTELEKETEKPKAANLLNIPICSLLGQKIQKYVQVDTLLPVLTNSESFCKTPTKNSFLEKLRKKPTLYPITYKPRRWANHVKQHHLYKFTKKERKDFYWKLMTGLNSESRKKLKLVKKSSVELKRLTEDTLLKWMTRRKMERQLYKRYKKVCVNKTDKPGFDEFPAGPTLLSKNMDRLLGLRRSSSKSNNALSLSNYVSEYIDAEVSKLQLTLYKCLLHEMSVLKPTVRINDLHPSFQQSSHDSVVNKTATLESAKQLPKHMISGDSISKLSEEDKGIINKKVSETQTQLGVITKVSKKTPTVRRLLTSPSLAERDQLVNKISKAKELDKEPISPEAGTTKVLKNTANSSILSAKTCGENLSVISLSSNSDSFGSECSVGCKVERGKTIGTNLNELDWKQSRTVILDPSNSMNLMISVDSDKDLLLQKAEKMVNSFGMPSPSSSSEESSTPPSTPSKVESVTCLNRPRSNMRSIKSDSSNLIGAKNPILERHSSQINHTLKDQEKSTGLKTRAKSLTPSSSPKKKKEISRASLPNTPRKHKSEEKGSEILQLSPDNTGKVLRRTASKLGSFESTPISRQSRTCSLKPRNLSESSPDKLSPIKSMPNISMFKSSYKLRSLSNSSPVRTSKRLRSVDIDMQTTGYKKQRISWSCSPRK